MEKFKSRKAFASELSITTRTLERKLKTANYHLRKGMLSPQDQHEIKRILGYLD